jgi:hypothetical protein
MQYALLHGGILVLNVAHLGDVPLDVPGRETIVTDERVRDY